MFSEKEFDVWSIENKIQNAAKTLIQNIRNSQPSRVVGGGKYNVSGRYPSRKMRLTIQFESHRVELASIYEKEHDPDILEYYDQPPSIKLNYPTKDDKNIGVMSTPDFFVIHKNGAYWEEWKTEEELLKLSVRSPNRYVREKNGTWRCSPGEEYAAKYGLQYKLRSSSEIDWIFQRNIIFLEDYLTDASTVVTENAKREIETLIGENLGVLLSELITSTANATSDDIYLMISREEIYVDIYKNCIAEPDTVKVYRNLEHAKAYGNIIESNYESIYEISTMNIEVGQRVLWDGVRWMIINVGEYDISLSSDTKKYINLPNDIFEAYANQGRIKGINNDNDIYPAAKHKDIILKADKEDLEIANYRYKCVKKVLSGQESDQLQVPARTIRRWIKSFKDAQEIYGNGYVGLIPDHKMKGNRTNKLPDESLEIANEFIENDYETKKQKSRFAVYGALLNECEKRGLLAPSYKTFCNMINNRKKEEQVKKRMGNRAAYKYEKFYWELTLTTPRHGDRPFEIGHIDHTELDLELIHSRIHRNLGRCWITFLSDAFARRILSVYVTFDPPSYRSVMMALRECVRRHNRLPQSIVIDGGKEFNSVYFETFLAHYEVLKKQRPPAKARFGSVIERLFGTTNTEFINNLHGNTQIMKNVRQVTKSVNPKQHAIWTLNLLHERLCIWAYEVYDTIEHPALGQKPRDAFQLGMTTSGSRPKRFVPFDDIFKIISLATTGKGCAKVQVGQGVRINCLYYWSDLMKDPGVENKQVPIRYDPYDIGIAYAYIKGNWVKCISEYYSILKGRTEKELQMITEEIRKQKKNSSMKVSITAKKIAKFIRENEEIEAIQMQRLKDFEAKQVFNNIGNQCEESKENIEKDICFEENANIKNLSVYGVY